MSSAHHRLTVKILRFERTRGDHQALPGLPGWPGWWLGPTAGAAPAGLRCAVHWSTGKHLLEIDVFVLHRVQCDPGLQRQVGDRAGVGVVDGEPAIGQELHLQPGLLQLPPTFCSGRRLAPVLASAAPPQIVQPPSYTHWPRLMITTPSTVLHLAQQVAGDQHGAALAAKARRKLRSHAMPSRPTCWPAQPAPAPAGLPAGRWPGEESLPHAQRETGHRLLPTLASRPAQHPVRLPSGRPTPPRSSAGGCGRCARGGSSAPSIKPTTVPGWAAGGRNTVDRRRSGGFHQPQDHWSVVVLPDPLAEETGHRAGLHREAQVLHRLHRPGSSCSALAQRSAAAVVHSLSNAVARINPYLQWIPHGRGQRLATWERTAELPGVTQNRPLSLFRAILGRAGKTWPESAHCRRKTRKVPYTGVGGLLPVTPGRLRAAPRVQHVSITAHG